MLSPLQEYLIRPIEDKDLKKLGNFLLSHELGYLNYNKWIEKTCLPEIYFSQKTGIIAIVNSIVVADIIFQKHKQLPKTLEIKNLRVDRQIKGRSLAYFLMKQAELYAKFQGCGELICDSRANKNYSNTVIDFLQFCGFNTLFKTDSLYKDGYEDYVFCKRLTKNFK